MTLLANRAWAVFRFELAYQAGRASTRVYFAIFVSFVFVLARVFANAARNDGYAFNAPVITAAVTILASMVALLVTAGIAGDAATRDTQTRIDSLLHTTPVGKAAYLTGRFLGAFTIAASLLVAVPLALLLVTNALDPALRVPFRGAAYLTSYALFALPNAFVTTALLFAIAALTRRAIATYAGAALLFAASLLSHDLLAAHFGQWALAKLLDPLGFTIVRALWHSLTPLQKNTRLIALDASLLSNRLLWLALACSALAIAVLRFRFAYAGDDRGARGLRALRSGAAPIDADRSRPFARSESPLTVRANQTMLRVQRTFNSATRIRQLLAVTRDSFRALITGRAWLVVPIVAAAFVAIAPELLKVELGTPGAATSARIATILGAFEPSLLLVLLTALYAGELVWRERDARMQSLADVTPLSETLAFLGRFLGLALVLAISEAVFLAAGVVAQIIHGTGPFDLGVFIKILFGFHLTSCLLFAALAMFLHVLVNQKYVGTVMVILAFAITQFAHELGIEHNLLIFGGAPSWSHSDMTGFAPQVAPWCWFTLYWSAWALLLGVTTALLWTRGEERGLRARLATARRRITPAIAMIGGCAIALIVATGSFTFYNTNVLNHSRSASEEEARSARYEQRYGHFATLAQPLLTATQLQVDLFPSRGAATIHGRNRFENRSGAIVRTIHLATNSDVTTTIAFDRASHLTLRDDDLGYRVYALDTPLQPGQSLLMTFDVAFAPRGFTNEGRDATILGNGSWIEHRGSQTGLPRQWLPVIGYQRGRELDDAVTRKQYGLRERPAVSPLADATARNDGRGREQIAFEAVVSTDADQTAIAPGALRRTWTAHGRRFFHYVADAPISNIYAIFSARYRVQRTTWRDVSIEIAHHPAHTANVDRMLRAVRASLDCYTRAFGPYPHRQLRLVEFPSAGRSLQLTAYPGLIKYSEGVALARPDDDARQIDLPYAVVAHEMAHQWWAHQLVPAPVEGAPLLTESLAWYSAMRVVEQSRGRDQLLRLLDVMRAEYLAPHQPRTVPLLRAVDSIDAYRTGPFAMFALRESIGEERVNAALRRLLARFDPSHAPYPTSLDLYRELRAVAPPSGQPLLKDLFEEITFWDLRTRNAGAQRLAGNTWRVIMQIDAQKRTSDATGQEAPVAMNDDIEVAVFDARENALHRQRHRIHSGLQTITFDVVSSQAPMRAAIDPDHALLDREPDNNSAAVTLARR